MFNICISSIFLFFLFILALYLILNFIVLHFSYLSICIEILLLLAIPSITGLLYYRHSLERSFSKNISRLLYRFLMVIIILVFGWILDKTFPLNWMAKSSYIFSNFIVYVLGAFMLFWFSLIEFFFVP